MRVAIVIPTTAGPGLVDGIERLDVVPASRVHRVGDYRPLDALSDRYHHLTDPAGPLRSFLDEGSPHYRLTIDQPPETGRSWELPVALAHWVRSQGHEIVREAPDAIVWSTGAIQPDGTIYPDSYHVIEKLRLSKDLIWQLSGRSLAGEGATDRAGDRACRLFFLFPQGQGGDAIEPESRASSSGPDISSSPSPSPSSSLSLTRPAVTSLLQKGAVHSLGDALALLGPLRVKPDRADQGPSAARDGDHGTTDATPARVRTGIGGLVAKILLAAGGLAIAASLVFFLGFPDRTQNISGSSEKVASPAQTPAAEPGMTALSAVTGKSIEADTQKDDEDDEDDEDVLIRTNPWKYFQVMAKKYGDEFITRKVAPDYRDSARFLSVKDDWARSWIETDTRDGRSKTLVLEMDNPLPDSVLWMRVTLLNKDKRPILRENDLFMAPTESARLTIDVSGVAEKEQQPSTLCLSGLGGPNYEEADLAVTLRNGHIILQKKAETPQCPYFSVRDWNWRDTKWTDARSCEALQAKVGTMVNLHCDA